MIRVLLLILLVFVLPFALVLLLVARAAGDGEPERVVTVETVVPDGLFDVLFPAPSTTSTTLPRPAPVVKPARNQPKTTAPTVPAATNVPVGELADIIRSGFARFGRDVAEQAVRVAGCESTGDATGQRLHAGARNGDHWGLFQIAWRWHQGRVQRLGFTQAQLLEPAANVAVAVDIYADSGWGPWTCRNAA